MRRPRRGRPRTFSPAFTNDRMCDRTCEVPHVTEGDRASPHVTECDRVRSSRCVDRWRRCGGPWSAPTGPPTCSCCTRWRGGAGR
eukprot:1187710-Prorocentrum_minimum.AAC.2